MDTEGALVIELRQPDWVDDAQTRAATWPVEPPAALVIDIEGAPAPAVSAAQTLVMLGQQAARSGVPVSVTGQSGALLDGMRRYGLEDALPIAGGDPS